MLKRIQEPEAWEPQINQAAFETLDMAIEALDCSESPNSSDTISRQAAIDAADAVWSVTGDKNVAKVWDQIKDLPSAQPEKRTEKRTETHACDLIDRHAAIDAVNTALFPKINTAKDAEKALRALPSAQPDHVADSDKKVSISCSHENDLISRQAAIDALADMHCKSDEDGYTWIIRSDAWARIDALPSVTPTKIVAQINFDNAKLKEIVDEAVKRLEEELEPKRKTGKWEEKAVSDEKVIDEWQSARCSVCGKYHTAPYMYYFDNYNYCPNCGARMTEEDV